MTGRLKCLESCCSTNASVLAKANTGLIIIMAKPGGFDTGWMYCRRLRHSDPLHDFNTEKLRKVYNTIILSDIHHLSISRPYRAA